MRLAVLAAALLALWGCGSSPKSQPATASAVAADAATPAVDTPPSNPASRPVVSPDGSVRRAHPEEVVEGRAPLASECEGDACRAVTVTWLAPGFRFENTGSRDVAITIWFAAKGDCLRSEFSIAASKHSDWGNVGFCKPYSATYK